MRGEPRNPGTLSTALTFVNPEAPRRARASLDTVTEMNQFNVLVPLNEEATMSV